MQLQKNAINWFEIPVADFDRAKKFYSTIYEFDMPEMNMDGVRMGFFLYDQQSMGVGGAIVHGDGLGPSAGGPKVYLNGGDDLDNVLNRVQAAGGKVVLPKTEITPEFGYYATFEDTEGNEVSLHSMG